MRICNSGSILLFLIRNKNSSADSTSNFIMAIDDLTIEKFSKHLFWDVDRNQLDSSNDKAYIIKQVLEYGLLHDWVLIQKYYDIEQIAQTAKKFRELDKKALSFIALLSHSSKQDFRRYTLQQSKPRHWDF